MKNQTMEGGGSPTAKQVSVIEEPTEAHVADENSMISGASTGTKDDLVRLGLG